MHEEGKVGSNGGIVIHVEPLQAAFFAGETFSARITFTNTHPVVPPPTSEQSNYPLNGGHAIPERPATVTGVSFKHKRAAHSVTYGSAPLANPPTSPGTPNYSSQFAMSTPSLTTALTRTMTGSTAVKPPSRKGLIGQGDFNAQRRRLSSADGSELHPRPLNGSTSSLSPEQRRRMFPRRSISIDVNPMSKVPPHPQSPVHGDQGVKFAPPRAHPPSPLSRSRGPSVSSVGDPSHPTVSPSRSPSMAIPKAHPHARKQSVVDPHETPHEISSSISSINSSHSSSSAPSTSSSVPPSPSTGVSTTSAFSLGLDPINEAPSASSLPNGTMRTSKSSPIPSSGAVLHSPRPIKHEDSIPMLANSRVRASSLTHGPSTIGLGHPAKVVAQPNHGRSQSTQTAPVVKSASSRSAFSSSFALPNTEVLLWSYAQLIGTVEFEETSGLVSPEAAMSVRSRLSSLRSDGVIGGGRMDIGANLTPSPISVGSRTRRGFISNFLGGSSPIPSPVTPGSGFGLGITSTLSSFWGSPSAPTSPSPNSNGLSINTSMAGISSPMTGISGGLPASALPTFETQPSMLAVDLNLPPGESRTFTYSIPLPAVLPPTFRGKAIKFSYHLVIGSSRASTFPIPPTPTLGSGGGPSSNQSKIMRVPIRLYNNVSVERPPTPYDLLWPLARRRAGPVKPSVVEDPPETLARQLVVHHKRPALRGEAIQFEEYAKRLLALSGTESHNERPPDAEDDRMSAAGTIRGPSIKKVVATRQNVMSPSTSLVDLDDELSGTLVGCRENVEILTRVSKKSAFNIRLRGADVANIALAVSYDINKDGVKVAVLTFVKTAFRLGESVMGVVELNAPESRARVLKFSAVLEAHEIIPPRLVQSTTGTPTLQFTKSRSLRRVHAEHHSSAVSDCSRITFTLDIPSDASPGFRITVDDGSDAGGLAGGLEWKVRICFYVAFGSPRTSDGSGPSRMRHLIRDGAGGEWGTSWKATPSLAPLTRTRTSGVATSRPPSSPVTAPSGWSFFSRSVDHATEKDIEGWHECPTETIECEVGITVWPGNTLYRPATLDFEV
ncbi:hypothetical protein FRB99_008670 [Tulasnella sp. 403]|nr:hypothetical protein FRB99_008670 [Tulasnella sp. 403]